MKRIVAIAMAVAFSLSPVNATTVEGTPIHKTGEITGRAAWVHLPKGEAAAGRALSIRLGVHTRGTRVIYDWVGRHVRVVIRAGGHVYRRVVKLVQYAPTGLIALSRHEIPNAHGHPRVTVIWPVRRR